MERRDSVHSERVHMEALQGRLERITLSGTNVCAVCVDLICTVYYKEKPGWASEPPTPSKNKAVEIDGWIVKKVQYEVYLSDEGSQVEQSALVGGFMERCSV